MHVCITHAQKYTTYCPVTQSCNEHFVLALTVPAQGPRTPCRPPVSSNASLALEEMLLLDTNMKRMQLVRLKQVQ